jgi:iron complex outermembrane receptor protein
MTLKTNQLRDAVVFALFVGATTVAGTGLAFAQATTPAPATSTSTTKTPDATTLDRIEVTGTRIKSQTVTASSPVTEIQQAEFQYTGTTRTEDLVNQYPQMAPAFDAFTNNGALGYPTVDLRGLGASRTLTLVNGMRLAPGANEAADISIVPSFLVKRVDLLTGGASAVYGSDAVAGVVNFILDKDFTGVRLSVGHSAYQHNNDNSYIQGLEKARGFQAPSGNTGPDGSANDINIAVGSSFADDRGHAMAWLTWRQNASLFQGRRDYSACALNAAGTKCGGSNTNAAGNFYFYQPGSTTGSAASLNPDGTYKNSYGAPFNYAPLNYYQRPDSRYTFGSSIDYEINEHFKPYLETMYITKKDAVELAPSGAFFTKLSAIDCTNPLIGSACSNLGFSPANGPVDIYVAKRNVEGGPRHTDTNTSQFRVVAGTKGAIDSNWSYDAYFLYGQTNSTSIGRNDFLTSRIVSGILGCPAGSFAGCLPYKVFVPGGVTPEAARALQGTSLNDTRTTTKQVSAFITGDIGYGSPWANGKNISVVVGGEYREDQYTFNSDSDSQAGNFAGAGGPTKPIAGTISVRELFSEMAVPVFRDMGFLKAFDLDLGYRLSDYNLAGRTDTFKLGFTSELGSMFRVRGGFNRATRAPQFANLFATQQIALFAGTDPCAGPTPTFTAAQCANTGVTAARYGLVPNNSAGQYNQFIGGNLTLKPEKADTYTLGFVVTPFDALQANLDYYDIKIKDTITSIGAQTILDFCGKTGDATLCSLVHRNKGSGDLFRGNDPATAGLITNLTNNFGEIHFRGLDLGATYRWDMFGGRMSTSFQGNYLLQQQIAPLAGVNAAATYDCRGKINVQCESPKWRHIADVRYSRDWFTANLRWRYFGKMDYIDQTRKPLVLDKLVCGGAAGCLGSGRIAAFNYIDLSASAQVGTWGELTVGVNNIADKAPPITGNTLALNGNSPGGFDQAGRYFFSNFTVNF